MIYLSILLLVLSIYWFVDCYPRNKKRKIRTCKECGTVFEPPELGATPIFAVLIIFNLFYLIFKSFGVYSI